VQGRRPKEAWQETGTAWRAELAYGLVAGVLVCVYFIATKWPANSMATVGLPIGAAVGAAILVPLAQFFWRLIWQPWNDLKTKVADLADDDHMSESERLVVVLRNYLRQGFELEAYRLADRTAGAFYTWERDELADWTHDVVTCLTEYGTKAHCEKFIEADKLCTASGHAVHREWAMARIAVLEVIIEELDPSPDAQSSSTAISSRDQT
jgi:hypothetical protein